MGRKTIYLLLSKVGPSKDEQLKLIRKVVPATDRQQQIYVDDLTIRYRRQDQGLEQQEIAFDQLRRGDTWVIATPGCMGSGRDNVREMMIKLAQKGCPILVASTGKTITWTQAVADAVAFLDAAVLEKRRRAAETARLAKAALGHTYVPQPKPLTVTDAEARQMWYDEVMYPTQREVAEICGVTARTLWNRFGPRRPSPLKRRKRRARS